MNSKWEKNCGLIDDNERNLCRAEIDVLVALLYNLSLKEICFVLDPQQIYGEKFPPGYFHVLKNMEFRDYGEYRTKRLILEKYDELKDKFKNL